jgi:EAL and modified HD-GYP domain-containing signal transduction protein
VDKKPTPRWAFSFGETRVFDSLKKMFGKKADQSAPATTAPEPAGNQPQREARPVGGTDFLRREAVFDRNNRLSGHLFRLQQSSLLADGEGGVQRDFDRILLDTLNASPDAWNTSRAFIPLSSSSLDSPALDRLKSANVILIVQLAADAEASMVGEAIEHLHQRGFQIGLCRQPKHPAFAKVIQQVDYAVIDVGANEASTVRDFSAAVRAAGSARPLHLFACNVETFDDHLFCHQWHFENFHGKFAESAPTLEKEQTGDPHKAQLLNLMRLVQSDAETAEIAAAMKLDPLLSFRILRYLNSPALGLSHRIDSLEQALVILGRQRLTRWLAVLLFSVREPQFSDWLMVENALTRGRLMESLGEQTLPGKAHDPLFLTGIFSCLDRLLRKPMAEALGELPIAEEIRQALIERSGPYAALLAVAEAGEDFDLPRLQSTALAAGVDPHIVNRALLAATAWASEVTEYWE